MTRNELAFLQVWNSQKE